MRARIIAPVLAAVSTLAIGLHAHDANAVCDHLTRPFAARVSTVARLHAPPWARSLLTPVQLMRFDSAGLHELTYFIGYGAITLERLGTGGVAPYSVTVVVRCRDGRAEAISDPYEWANARARELHLSIARAEQAAGLAAEVISLSSGRRPDAANASRHGGVFRVDVSLSPRQGDSAAAPQMLVLEVGRDASVRRVEPGAPEGGGT